MKIKWSNICKVSSTQQLPSHFNYYLSFKVHSANNLYYVSLRQIISYLVSFPTCANAGVLSPQCDYKLLEMVTLLSFSDVSTEFMEHSMHSVNTGHVYRVDYINSEKQKNL